MTSRRLLSSCIAIAVFSISLSHASPSRAAWEGSAAEDVTAKVVDAVLIRPLATARVLIGAALLAPSALFAAPSGREGIESAYEVLVAEPMKYAFERDLGDL